MNVWDFRRVPFFVESAKGRGERGGRYISRTKSCVRRDGDCIMRRRKCNLGLLLWRIYHSCTYV